MTKRSYAVHFSLRTYNLDAVGGVQVFFFKCTLFTTLLFILFQSLAITGKLGSILNQEHLHVLVRMSVIF
jgi:hypothetical protein